MNEEDYKKEIEEIQMKYEMLLRTSRSRFHGEFFYGVKEHLLSLYEEFKDFEEHPYGKEYRENLDVKHNKTEDFNNSIKSHIGIVKDSNKIRVHNFKIKGMPVRGSLWIDKSTGEQDIIQEKQEK